MLNIVRSWEVEILVMDIASVLTGLVLFSMLITCKVSLCKIVSHGAQKESHHMMCQMRIVSSLYGAIVDSKIVVLFECENASFILNRKLLEA